MDEFATPETPRVSPSGQRRLVVVDTDDKGVPAWTFHIEDRNGRLEFGAPDRFDRRHRTFFLWHKADRVWVYSGDVGTFLGGGTRRMGGAFLGE